MNHKYTHPHGQSLQHIGSNTDKLQNKSYDSNLFIGQIAM